MADGFVWDCSALWDKMSRGGRDLEKIMSAITQYNAFSKALFHRMELDGFKQRSKSTTQKKQGKYFSQLVLYTNKLRGIDTIRQTYIIRQSFPEIDNVIYYLMNDYFSSQWFTGRIWLCTLMPIIAKTSGLPNAVAPNGYTHYLNDNMDISQLAEEVYNNIAKYAYPFLEEYSSPQTILLGLEEERPKLKTWAVHGSDLFRLACYLFFHQKEKALNFCEQRMKAAQCDDSTRTSITQEILDRADKLEWRSDGSLLVPPKPTNIIVR